MESVEKYEYESKPMTALEIRAGVNLIQEVMKGVMQSGTHYGKIPGTGASRLFSSLGLKS